jgi:hypothetical protein
MPQRIAVGAALLLPEAVGYLTNSLGGILFVLNESGPLDLREAFRIVFRHKSQDGFMAVDGHNDSRNGYPSHIIPSCYFNAEGHSPLSKRFMPYFVSFGNQRPNRDRFLALVVPRPPKPARCGQVSPLPASPFPVVARPLPSPNPYDSYSDVILRLAMVRSRIGSNPSASREHSL